MSWVRRQPSAPVTTLRHWDDTLITNEPKKRATTTQFPRRLIKEKAEVRQRQRSVPPFPHFGNIDSVQLVLTSYLV
jgi:hypothetical protein